MLIVSIQALLNLAVIGAFVAYMMFSFKKRTAAASVSLTLLMFAGTLGSILHVAMKDACIHTWLFYGAVATQVLYWGAIIITQKPRRRGVM